MYQDVIHYLKNLQKTYCSALEKLEKGKSFLLDPWEREGVSYGITCILEKGDVWERAGVNFSALQGHQLPPAASAQHPELAGLPFQATGLSWVIHPKNPYVPTVHGNLRFFIARDSEKNPFYWFGGGYDLTPYYSFEEDGKHWHENAQSACTPFGETLYKQFKKQCDEYFYLNHRKEPRGIGGLFFDDHQTDSFEKDFGLIQSIGNSFLPGYLPIVHRRCATPYGEKEREFQLYRRGRYVEFNLIYDRGTLFGLQWGGRIESILVSLPPLVTWHYAQGEDSLEEKNLLECFLKFKHSLDEA